MNPNGSDSFSNFSDHLLLPVPLMIIIFTRSIQSVHSGARHAESLGNTFQYWTRLPIPGTASSPFLLLFASAFSAYATAAALFSQRSILVPP